MSDALVLAVEQELLFPATEHLCAVLSSALDQHRPGARIVDMERAPCPFGSSWWLEDITLEIDDGSRMALVFKNLVRETDGSGARRVKPPFVTDPTREPWVYQNLLIDGIPGPPKLWASLNDVAGGRHWLFLERVNGVPLAQVGDRDAWCAAADWLGRFHATAPIRRGLRGPLPQHNQKYHRRWLARALSAMQHRAQTSDAARDKLARLRALIPVHEHATAQTLAKGASIIHGEFYPSNVLIDQHDATITVHPVDWEMTALGPPFLDLAALMSGSWSQGDRIAMATAYREATRSARVRCPTLEELLLGVAACRLLLAIQWLGWSADWTAPEAHRNDWLEEAELCARELRG